MGTIVVGVDGSEGSKHALELAAKQARMSGDSLDIVATWEIPTWMVSGSASGAPDALPDYDFPGEAKRHLQETVAAVLGASPDLKYREIIAEGHASLALVRAAEDADLLVIGSRGHGEFTGMLLGSVSMYCATHATCPVLIARDKPAEKKS